MKMNNIFFEFPVWETEVLLDRKDEAEVYSLLEE